MQDLPVFQTKRSKLCSELHQEELAREFPVPAWPDRWCRTASSIRSGGSISTYCTQVAQMLWEESPDGALTHGHSRSLPANAVEEGWVASLSSPGSKLLCAAEDKISLR